MGYFLEVKSLLKLYCGRFLGLISHSSVISLLITIPIVFFLPEIFDKYNAEITDRTINSERRIIYFEDLNNDGISEKIIFQSTTPGMINLFVYENDLVLEQWNLEGLRIPSFESICGDVDNDGLTELFIFTYRNNKIFINCLSPFKNKFYVEDRFISEYFPVSNVIDCNVFTLGLFDNNDDGINELYFYTNVGFSEYPRKIFSYDVFQDSLISSPKSCASLLHSIPHDVENDGKIDFLAATTAVGNCDKNDAYTDWFAWLMVFNHDLSFKLEPKIIGNYSSISRIKPLYKNNEKFFVVFSEKIGAFSDPAKLSIYDNGFNKLTERKFYEKPEEWENALLYTKNDLNQKYFYIIKMNGLIEKYDSELEIVETINFPYRKFFDRIVEYDLDKDQSNELFFISRDQENLIIAESDFLNFTLLDLEGAKHLKKFAIKHNVENDSELHIQFKDISYLITYGVNPLYYLKYPIYIGIYLVLFAIITFIQKLQTFRIEQKHRAEKRMTELQIKAIKNQIDPHFTLNILNSIGALSYKNQPEKADYVFGKYCKLLVQTIRNSDKIVTTLSDELKFIQNYLDLEKFRFNNRFEYNIEIEKGIDPSLNIPRMLLHNFVENAVKHGLRHLDSGGKLFIKISNGFDKYSIVIRDNGVGRNATREIEFNNTNCGLDIIDQISEAYFDLRKVKITYKIIDLFNEESEPTGTEVQIKIPIDK
ncbi:MAG: histidine kinase [Candidatus Cloacimonetes bacterium]|nr:histidine kinase [Candidatus Cloacimonadota bacterium]